MLDAQRTASRERIVAKNTNNVPCKRHVLGANMFARLGSFSDIAWVTGVIREVSVSGRTGGEGRALMHRQRENT